MPIISFIEDHQIIRTILDHLGIWLVRARPPRRKLLICRSTSLSQSHHQPLLFKQNIS